MSSRVGFQAPIGALEERDYVAANASMLKKGNKRKAQRGSLEIIEVPSESSSGEECVSVVIHKKRGCVCLLPRLSLVEFAPMSPTFSRHLPCVCVCRWRAGQKRSGPRGKKAYH
jgi:hypothetical protein